MKRAVEEDAPWKSPSAGLFHLAWKSRKCGGIPTSPTAPTATKHDSNFPGQEEIADPQRVWLSLLFTKTKDSSYRQERSAIQLQVKTILNRIQAFVGFVYQDVRLCAGLGNAEQIEITVVPHGGIRGRCSACRRPAPGYDRLPERRWLFVPLWGIPTWFRYAPRRVECAEHGVAVEYIPWSDGKRPVTCAMMGFLARWARRLSWRETALSWRETAQAFQTSWEAVYRSVEWFVEWGLEHRQLDGVTSIGVDEIHWGHGTKADNFLTVIYQIDAGCRRLLWIGKRRSEKTLRQVLRRGNRVRGEARKKLNALLASKLNTARAWELKEAFLHFWKYKSPIWAGAFLDYWCHRAMRSRLEPMQKVARMLRNHEELLLNWFRAKGELSSGAVEGLNNKIRVITRRSFGFRTFKAMQIALYHTLGRLPEPESTHRFC